MRLVAFTLFATFAGPVAHAAPVPKHLMKEPETDKAKLQGRWKVESMRMGQQDVLGGLGVNFEMVIEFRDDTLTATANIGGMSHKTTATVSYGTGGARQLRTNDQRTVGADGKPMNDGQKEDVFGYAFDGDKLLLGSTPGGGQKVAVDPLKPGPNDVVIVLSRVKK